MDAVSHLIRLARLDASLDKHCVLGGSTRMDVSAGGEREATFHVLLEGTCTLQVGHARVDLSAGDVVLIPSGRSHRVLTAGTGPTRGTAETAGDAFVTTRSSDGGEPVIDLFCGHYTFGPGAGALLFRSLPEPVHVSFGRSAASDDTLRMLSTLMRGEAQQEGEGTAAILSALCTVLLAMVLRTSRDLGASAALWTAGGDTPITLVIERVLQAPGDDWSIERLSRIAAMSRATFLRHFTRSTGMTVGTFLVQARLMAAAERLLTTEDSVSTVANRVGYRSESAFTRSFRAAIGTTPARFRKGSTGPSRPARPAAGQDGI